MTCLDITVRVPSGPERTSVLGSAERNLKMIRETLGVEVAARDGLVRVTGDPTGVVVARSVLSRLAQAALDATVLDRQTVLELIAEQSSQSADLLRAEAESSDRASAERGWPADPDPKKAQPLEPAGVAWTGDLQVYSAGKPIRPRTQNQFHYIEAVRAHDLVFGIGPAGTGKTYLAVAAAVHLLKVGRVQRVVLARPAVEAGERLGFLPGDLQEKVNPYLRPLFDALHDFLDYPTIRRFMENDVIEVSPLAFMRGRTLNNSVIILDEAQNTTRVQMQMFLTRLGQGSRAIVTGDTTQIDLPRPEDSGLIDAARRLGRVRGVAFQQLTGEDVVRHELVQRIVRAYGEPSRDQADLNLDPGTTKD